MFCVISHKGPRPQATLEALPSGMLRFDFPFDYDFLWEFKRIIPSRRAVYTDGEFDYWTVDPEHAEEVADLTEQWGMDRPQVPVMNLPDEFRSPEFDVLDEHIAEWQKEDDPWDSVGG